MENKIDRVVEDAVLGFQARDLVGNNLIATVDHNNEMANRQFNQVNQELTNVKEQLARFDSNFDYTNQFTSSLKEDFVYFEEKTNIKFA